SRAERRFFFESTAAQGPAHECCLPWQPGSDSTLERSRQILSARASTAERSGWAGDLHRPALRDSGRPTHAEGGLEPLPQPAQRAIFLLPVFPASRLHG